MPTSAAQAAEPLSKSAGDNEVGTALSMPLSVFVAVSLEYSVV
jgi:hypothetical protein